MKSLLFTLPLLALAACADTGSPAKDSRLGITDRQNLTVAQQAQIRAILQNDEPTLSQRRRIRAILAR